MELYSFIITSGLGVVLDFGTYRDDKCCQDTANESPAFNAGNTVTLMHHDDDGSSEVVETYVVPQDVMTHVAVFKTEPGHPDHRATFQTAPFLEMEELHNAARRHFGAEPDSIERSGLSARDLG